MIEKTVQQLANMIQVHNDISSFQDQTVQGVSINSKSIQQGNLFIPLKGEKHDGHEFVEQAMRQGAGASLWQKDVPNPPTDLPILIVDGTLEALQQLARVYRDELSLKVVAVTGSNGKTTTKDILAEVLSVKYKVQKTSGNFNNHIGLPLTILGLQKDTEVAVLEMGMSNFGEIDFLTKMAKPDAAIITNIGDAHLQELGSREGIAKAKLEIVNGLKSGGLFVYPGDEPLIVSQLMHMDKPWKIQTFGKSAKNDYYPTKMEMSATGSLFTINQSNITFNLPILGEYNVLNSLAAMIVAREWGVPFSSINEGFSKIKLTQMRLEMISGINGCQILNDAYNASPTSMKAVIDLVADLPEFDKKIVVLGDMLELGPQEQEFHKEVGHHISPEKVNYVYTYGELGKHIAVGAKEKFDKNRCFSFTDKTALIEHLKPKLDKQTIVLVKASRGIRLEEVVEGIKM